MDTETATWVNMLISWAPFLLLIAFWIFFMRRMGGGGLQRKQMESSIKYMERSELLLERIALALEERNRLQGP